MSDLAIFMVGLVTFLLLAGGIGFTIVEMRSLSKPETKKQ